MNSSLKENINYEKRGFKAGGAGHLMFHLLDIETGQDGGDCVEDGLFCDIVVFFTSSSFLKSNSTQLKQT